MVDPSHEPGTEPDPGTGRAPARRRWGAALAVVLAVVGLVLIGGGVAAQQQAPPDPAAPAGAATPAPRAPTVPAVPRSQAPPQPSAQQSPPASLRIPALDVSSAVNSVGLNPDRTMEVPAPGPRYDQAAWYRSSPSPGEPGPSVIIGHVDSAADGPSVFYRLGALEPGDRVEVTRADRSTVTFAVDTVRTFAKDAFPTQTVYGDTPGPELRLITCGGPFDSSGGSYRDNTVVFARQLA